MEPRDFQEQEFRLAPNDRCVTSAVQDDDGEGQAEPSNKRKRAEGDEGEEEEDEGDE